MIENFFKICDLDQLMDYTLPFKGKKLETNSSRKLQHVLNTINQN